MRNVKPVDLRLNAIVDPDRAGGHDLVDLARRVVEGGATLVQLRDKRSDTRAMIETARAIKAALTPSGVPFVVNDRVDVALAAGADGVHLGPEDMAVHDARRLLGPDAIIGLSIKSVEAAEAASSPERAEALRLGWRCSPVTGAGRFASRAGLVIPPFLARSRRRSD